MGTIFKIASYNIQHGQGMEGHFDLSRTAKVLIEINPDVVLVQEADCRRPKTGLTCQPGLLAKELNMEYAYGEVRRYRPGSYGNAILSRFPIIAKKNHLLPSETDQRCCLEVIIKAPMLKFTVFNLHLGLNSAERYWHLNEIILPLVQAINHPVILGGDFNVGPDSAEISLIKEFMLDSFQANSGNCFFTFPSANPYHRIDYIFLNKHWQLHDYKIINQTLASDHLPIMCSVSAKYQSKPCSGVN